jgi:carbon monoxide dehydrogenase subunit G
VTQAASAACLSGTVRPGSGDAVAHRARSDQKSNSGTVIIPMALRLENEFVVGAGIESTWDLLIDLGRVAQCLPGAMIEPPDELGVHRGLMRVKLGPVTMNYRGTAEVETIDADTHSAVFRVSGRDTRGRGTASAVIHNQLLESNGETRVVVRTELDVTGRPAQFGRGIMQDIAGAMLEEFAAELAAKIEQQPAAGSNSPPVTPMTPPEPATRLEVTSAVGGALRRRAALTMGAILLLAMALRGLRRR